MAGMVSERKGSRRSPATGFKRSDHAVRPAPGSFERGPFNGRGTTPAIHLRTMVDLNDNSSLQMYSVPVARATH